MGQVDAFWLLWDPVIANVSNFRLLVDLSLKNKVALIAPAPPFVEAGALMSVSADYEKAGQRASEMARLVLAGGRAGNFRAEPPPARLITINASVARQLRHLDSSDAARRNSVARRCRLSRLQAVRRDERHARET